MQNETVARRYATAVFTLAAKAGSVAQVGADLRAAVGAIYGNDDVRRFFLSPVFERKRKEALLLQVFRSRLGEITLHTLLLLVRKRREALLEPIGAEYDKLALAAAGKEPLEIVSARELAPQERDAIVSRLSRTYGKAFQVTVRVDPSLLGGVRVTLGDRRIDGSLAGRLDDIARELFSHHHQPV
ncbi:MAG: ATP synthase F1 subunit delta [Candidatus Eremiobacteraeota bacterium]|nr:ATP synthase F1 subunit delta [Candidatus Eremiobacteraeota bacterium]